MITITPAAAAQIKTSARQAKADGLALRMAAKRNNDGAIHYAMGFDDKAESDLSFTSEDVEIIVAPDSIDLLNGTELDFVTLADGETNFIFKNPNDPNYIPDGANENTNNEHHY